MSTKKKAAAATGIRYTDAQKKEILQFVQDYNSAKGRGGQSAASKKYNVTQLTISAWIKASGTKPSSKAAAKPAKSAKPAKKVAAEKAAPSKTAKAAKPAKSSSASKKGMRYSAAQKNEVVQFVKDYNSANGRGGQSQAASKFGLSVLTVSSWLKAAGVAAKSKAPAPKGAAPRAAASTPAGLAAKVSSLLALSDEIRKAEGQLDSLRAKHDALKAAIRAAL